MHASRILAVLLLAALQAFGADTQEDFFLRLEQSLRSEIRLRIYDWVQYRVEGSTVTLSGYVSLPSMRNTLEQKALRVAGVETVVNQIESDPLSGDDMGMRVNAHWRIYGNAALRQYAKDLEPRAAARRAGDDVQTLLLRPIHIVVRNGRLTLEGEVEQERDRVVAEEAANQVMGVRSVTNHLVVARGNTEELQAIDTDGDLWWSDASDAWTPVVRIENPAGLVKVQVTATDRLRFRTSSPEREVREGDVAVNRLQRKTRLRARPQDGARIDVDVDLPYGHLLEVETVDGPIELSGLIRRADIKTGSGAIRLTAPWQMVRLDVVADDRPPELAVLDGMLADDPLQAAREYGASWSLRDDRPRDGVLYGEIHVEAHRPDRLEVQRMGVPLDSPVRMHWEAPRVLETMFRHHADGDLKSREDGSGGPTPRPAYESEGVRFNSEVRLVDLTVSAVDSINRPITDLGPADFEVVEDGLPQEVRVVDGEEAPFNLALLLDCSTSTLTERSTVVQAARQFVSVARAQDHVAVYVLADGYVQVLSPLTNNHAELLDRIDGIPPLSGSTPLYDAIVMAYAQELAGRPWDRNALIVISDGMDNQILPPVGRTMPSKTPFEDLKRAAVEMSSVIYPIYLDAAEAPRPTQLSRERGWREQALSQLEQLAEASGGRVFRAPSVRALKNVYGQVADELRSVYRIGYYPKNQGFDGQWRHVELKIRRQGVFTRTRPGYYAW